MKLNKIYNTDCLEYMKTLDDESVDLVVTDPPYKIIAGGCRIIDESNECGGVLNRRVEASCKNEKMKKDVEYWYNNKVNNKKRDYSKTDPKGCLGRGRKVVSDGTNCSNKWLKKDNTDIISAVKDGKMFEHNDIKFSDWLPEVYRVLKKGTHAYIMINGRNLKDMQVEAEKVGFVYQNLLIWNKLNLTPNKYYMQGAEFILLLSKRPHRTINDMGTSNILSIKNEVGKKEHPTQKPFELFDILIKNSSNKGDIVLDPFMGRGTTAVSCIRTERNFIGCELDGDFYKMCLDNINQVNCNVGLFANLK